MAIPLTNLPRSMMPVLERPQDLPGQTDGLEVGIHLERTGPVGGIESPERHQPPRMGRGLPVAGRTVEDLERTGIVHPSIIVRFHQEPPQCGSTTPNGSPSRRIRRRLVSILKTAGRRLLL